MKQLEQRLISLEGKGLGSAPAGCRYADVAGLGWNLLNEDVSLPVAVLSQSRLQHNLRWMQTFIGRYGVQLSPHGKTTMSPSLFHLQLDHGAWGITLATASQVQAAWRNGIKRILMANQLVGQGNMALIADIKDDEFSFCCIVDSAENVDALGRYFLSRGQAIRVLLEYGVAGGRTGIRHQEQEDAILEAVKRWPQSVKLIGIELYEGVLKQDADVRSFLRHVLNRTRVLVKQSVFVEPEVILSGAGSAWYDVVAEEFSNQEVGQPLQVILRPGCYLTHDVGIYREAEQRIHATNVIAREMGQSLLPALQLWAYVQSRPEPDLAIMALGKRDAAFDAGYPVPALHFRPGGSAKPCILANDVKITAMMDQHAFMQVPADSDLKVGDMIAFDVSHPCLTFDKWRQLLLIDDQYQVVGAIETLF